MTRRTRDFTVLIGTTGFVLLMLVSTGALGLVEAFSALGVIASVGVAYFVGSAARLPSSALAPEPEKILRGAAEAGARLLAALPLPALEIGPGQKIIDFNRPAD